MPLDHLVRNSLKVPGSLADLVGPDGHLDHVVLTHGTQGLGARIVGSRPVLKEADRLLAGRQGVHHEAGGCDK